MHLLRFILEEIPGETLSEMYGKRLTVYNGLKMMVERNVVLVFNLLLLISIIFQTNADIAKFQEHICLFLKALQFTIVQ